MTKGNKKGVYILQKIPEGIIFQKTGKIYPSINSASLDILEYNEDVKETWYYYDNVKNEWKRCKYLLDSAE